MNDIAIFSIKPKLWCAELCRQIEFACGRIAGSLFGELILQETPQHSLRRAALFIL